MSGQPRLSEADLRAAGIPQRHWFEVREDFAEVRTEHAADTLARKWADRLLAEVEGPGDGTADPELLRSMLGQ